MNKNLRYLWLAIFTVLGLFIGGKWNIPLAAWLAPVFAIRFFRDSDKAGRSFILLWLATAVPIIISWNGATSMSLFNPVAEPIFFILSTPIGLIPYVVDRLYSRRFPNTAWVTLVFPIAFTAVDFITTSGTPFGTFGAVAYTQRGFLPVMQLASVTGLWGITFIIGWFASLVNHVWENGFKFTRFTLASTCILLIVLLLGFGRTLLKPQPEQTPIIAGFSLPDGTVFNTINQFRRGDETGFRQTVDKLNAEQLNQIRTMANDGANIVSLQEGAVFGMSDQVEQVISDASILAKEENIYIVLPTVDLGKSPAENKVHIIDPNGEVLLTHVKYGGNQFEGTLKGDGVLQTVDTPYGKLSAVICWDADFPNVIKQAGEKNVDLLFIPSNDWLGVKDIHAGMATFRAVENGMSIFRQTGQGVSLVSDGYGNTLNRVDTFEETAGPFAGVQNVRTPVSSMNTLYPQVGDIFGNVMLLGLAGLFIGLIFTRKK
jgi:apolipoprotein N-acyltransferase